MKYRLLCLLSLLLFASTPVFAANVAKPDKTMRTHAAQWRQALLEEGGAGLYQQLDTAAFANKAGITGLKRHFMDELSGYFAGDAPKRARVYWNATLQVWMARLDYGPQQTDFLKLMVENGKLVDWYDYSLGVSLSAIFHAANTLYETRQATFDAAMKALSSDSPRDALSIIEASSPLARMVIAACPTHACYLAALNDIPLREGEVSLFALRKASEKADSDKADAMMAALQKQLGEDPAVAALAGSLGIKQHACNKTLAVVKPALAKWPRERRLYPLVSQCYMMQGKPKQALATLKQMQKRTGLQVNWKALVKAPIYAPLAELLDN